MTTVTEKKHLEVGQRCWYYVDRLLYVVDIIDRTLYLEGEPSEFAFYIVRRFDGLVEESVHRAQLTPCTTEGRSALIQRLKDDARLLDLYVRELSEQENDHIPELGDDI